MYLLDSVNVSPLSLILIAHLRRESTLLPGSPLPGGLAEMKLNPPAHALPTAGSRVPHLVPTVLVSYRQPLHTGAS